MSLNSSQGIYGSVEEYTYTEGNVQRNTIKWSIPDFMNILNNKSILEIRAPKPTTTAPVESKFHLMMQFLGEERNMIEIYYLSPTPEHLKTILVKMSYKEIIGRYNCYSITENDVTTKECQFVQANKWQYLTYLWKSNPTNTSYKNNITLIDGSLRLTFEFNITIKNDVVASFLASPTQTPETELAKDLENLFMESTYSDIVMKSADNEEVRVHKVLLASRSPVLKAHFEHNFTENITNVVKSPLEATVLREVLTFIYTDKVSKLDEFPEKLLAAADYYQLNQLKSLCADALFKKLTVDNAIEILQLADLYSAKKLKQQTLEFIKSGSLELIIKTEGWSKLDSIPLLKDMFASVATLATEYLKK